MIGHITSLLYIYISRNDGIHMGYRIVVIDHLSELEVRDFDQQKLLICFYLLR